VSASLDRVDLLPRTAIAKRREKRERRGEERERVFFLRAFCACFVLAVLLAVSGFRLVFALFFVL
jgi:Flp pilus assembly protein TadB